MVRYCVLWMPTIQHDILLPNVADGSSNEEEISINDVLCSDDSTPKIFLDFSLLAKEQAIENFIPLLYDRRSIGPIPLRNIVIKAKHENGSVFDTLILQCIDARQNGLFQYCYNVDPKYLDQDGEGKYLLNSNLNITNAIYHHIKSFYHTHEFHDAIKDSILHPFSSDRPVDLTQVNNPALLHYIDEFSKVLVDEHAFIKELKSIHFEYYRNLSLSISQTDSRLQPNTYTALIQEKIHYLNHQLTDCVAQCNKALNMHTYYQSLLFSQYNKTYNPILSFFSREKLHTDFHRKILNAANAIKAITLLHKEMSEFVFNESLRLNQNFLQLIDFQVKAINRQNNDINRQSKKISKQTKAIRELTDASSKQSTRLTIYTCAISVLCSLIISLIFYLLQ